MVIAVTSRTGHELVWWKAPVLELDLSCLSFFWLLHETEILEFLRLR